MTTILLAGKIIVVKFDGKAFVHFRGWVLARTQRPTEEGAPIIELVKTVDNLVARRTEDWAEQRNVGVIRKQGVVWVRNGGEREKIRDGL